MENKEIAFEPEGEWQNGLPIEFDSGSCLSESDCLEQVRERLGYFSQAEIKRIKWIGVRLLTRDSNGDSVSIGPARLVDPVSQEWVD